MLILLTTLSQPRVRGIKEALKDGVKPDIRLIRQELTNRVLNTEAFILVLTPQQLLSHEVQTNLLVTVDVARPNLVICCVCVLFVANHL